MCKIIKIKYISPDGRRRSAERKELCFRSDGTNPCIYQEVSEMTELVSSGTPSLAGDEVPTPASASMPGTPLTATANFVYREPHDDGEPSSSKSRGRKSFGLSLDFGSRGKSSLSPTSPRRKHRSFHGSSRSGSSNGDADSNIGYEDRGHISPSSPSKSIRFSLGSPLSMRRTAQPAIVSQPQPPRLRSPTPAPPHHRRTVTAPDAAVRFDDSLDTELQDRADAREALRRENRERARREEETRRKQEADDRKLAEDLEAKERRERAADEFSMLEYARLQEKDRKRRERAEAANDDESSPGTQEEINQLEKEIREMKIKEDERRKARQDAERIEEKLRYEQRLRNDEAKIERRLQEDLAKIERQREASSKKHMYQIDTEMARLEGELTKIQERRQARERAEQLEQEIKHIDVLSEEIRELEADRERDAQLRRVEQTLYNRAYERQRYSPPAPAQLPPAQLPPAPAYAALPPTRRETQVVQQRNLSPYEDENYRRAVGERVLQTEHARAASSGLQRAIGAPPSAGARGLGRRNTIGSRERDRDHVYRDLSKRYP